MVQLKWRKRTAGRGTGQLNFVLASHGARPQRKIHQLSIISLSFVDRNTVIPVASSSFGFEAVRRNFIRSGNPFADDRLNTRSSSRSAKCLAAQTMMNPSALGVGAGRFMPPMRPGLANRYQQCARTRCWGCLVADQPSLGMGTEEEELVTCAERDLQLATHRWPSGRACWKKLIYGDNHGVGRTDACRKRKPDAIAMAN